MTYHDTSFGSDLNSILNSTLSFTQLTSSEAWSHAPSVGGRCILQISSVKGLGSRLTTDPSDAFMTPFRYSARAFKTAKRQITWILGENMKKNIVVEVPRKMTARRKATAKMVGGICVSATVLGMSVTITWEATTRGGRLTRADA